MKTEKQWWKGMDRGPQKPVYGDRIIVFLDILGFREIISQTTINVGLLQTVNQTFHNGLTNATNDYLSKASESGGQAIPVADRVITTFSDSIVISTDSNASQNELLIYVCDIFARFSAANVFFRGALSRGPLHHSSKVIFGPALYYAEELEREFSIYPRVLIDRKIPEFDSQPIGLSFPGQKSDCEAIFVPLILDPNDWSLIVNVMGYALAQAVWEEALEKYCLDTGLENPNDNPRMWREWPVKFRRNVEANLRLYSKVPAVKKKYTWLAEYYNDGYLNCGQCPHGHRFGKRINIF